MPDRIVIPRYGRWSREFEPALCPDTVRVLSPGEDFYTVRSSTTNPPNSAMTNTGTRRSSLMVSR